ncbi:unnamed protein product [Paramecium sonneborni]|uniref:Uncharacterized protein n=1 Tax=Paramecium sonneborni TaxID=65129 RepID=A0A8S1P175_9CILI|nr:unnamed protein product [Paramecium sonneborni]
MKIYFSTHQFIKLIIILKEIQLENQQTYEFNGKERLFSYILNEEDDLEIILLRNRNNEYLYHDKNYLQDGEIIMNKNQFKLSQIFQIAFNYINLINKPILFNVSLIKIVQQYKF